MAWAIEKPSSVAFPVHEDDLQKEDDDDYDDDDDDDDNDNDDGCI